jgi:hypothetical protein
VVPLRTTLSRYITIDNSNPNNVLLLHEHQFSESRCYFFSIEFDKVVPQKFEKYSEGVRSRPDIRFIPFAITEFGTLGGHAMAFLTELAKQAAASKGMHVGTLLKRRKVSLSPSMLLIRTTSCAICPPPRTVWRLFLP